MDEEDTYTSTMDIKYRKANIEDANLLIELYNSSFYSDYIKYGECPAYGKTREAMEKSIINYPKFIISYQEKPVGVISYQKRENGEYYIGCLCVIPEYQGKGIGTNAFQYFQSICDDWKRITLVTPVDKEENIKFYTEKCGFCIGEIELDGNVQVVRFYMEREL